MSTWDLPRLRSLRLREPGFKSSCHELRSWEPIFFPPESDCYALFGYIPVRGIQNDDERYVNRLVIDFKEGKASAIAAIATLAKEIITTDLFWSDDKGFPGYALAAPSSKVGIGSLGVNQLLDKIARPFPSSTGVRALSLTRSPHELMRTTALQTPSHQQKKSIEDHLGTIELVSELRPPYAETENLWAPDGHGPRVIVFDDVYTRGATFAACKRVIQDEWIDATYGYDSIPNIAGFFVAKTWARNIDR